MHKGVILLVKAQDADEAKEKVDEFMEPFGDGKVWDWFVIGGRWSGNLSPIMQQFRERAAILFKEEYPDQDQGFITDNMVKNQHPKLQTIWTDLGGKGLNPYSRDNYQESSEDIYALQDCQTIVKEWTKDMNQEAETFFTKMLEERQKETENPGTMSAYYASLYSECKYDNFCFESNIYDIENETNDPTEALKNTEGYFAVMVDMHN